MKIYHPQCVKAHLHDLCVKGMHVLPP